MELGNWNTTWDGAVGPMLTPNYPNWFLNVSVPAGQTIQFKFIKIAANGTVTWENGANHSYTVPTSGTGFVNVKLAELSSELGAALREPGMLVSRR